MSESTWPPRLSRETALEAMDALLAASPDSMEVRFNRAALLAELGRMDEAKSTYLDLLALDPAHFGALNHLGNLLHSLGYTTAACTVYLQAVAQHPDNPMGHVNNAPGYLILAAANATLVVHLVGNRCPLGIPNTVYAAHSGRCLLHTAVVGDRCKERSGHGCRDC